MSAAAAIAKLHSPLKELVAGVADAHHGKSEKDKAEVTEWIENVAAGQVGKPETLKVSSTLLSGETTPLILGDHRTWILNLRQRRTL